jgi:ATP-dependent DNA helicase RecG
MNLIALLQQPEGKTLEFKRDLSSPDGVLRTIVAFSNTAGGMLLIGVEDGSRHVRGVKEPLSTEERLANLISDNIVPRLVPDIDLLPWRGTHVIAVQVHPSPTRPHYLKGAGQSQGVYVRVGSTNRRADEQLRQELGRVVRGEAYDEQPLPELNSEAIDFRVASELFAPVRKLKRADLDTLRIITKYQGRKVPTVGGMLLFGIERTNYFSDAWIQAGRFKGTDRTSIVDHVNINELPVSAIERAIQFIQKHLSKSAEIGSLRRKDRWTIPIAALREAVINAVVHADYSQRGAPIRIALFDDRLEIENPGLLPFGLTVEDLHQGISRLRNRVIGRVFNELGLVEQWGSGIQRMTTTCHQSGLATPLLEEIGMRFRVTVFTAQTTSKRMDEVDRTIVAAIRQADGLTTQEVARVANLSARASRTRLIKLIERGLVREIGTSPQDPHRRYYSVG